MKRAAAAPHLVALAGTAQAAWRNGGGVTRELLAWPSAGAWVVRLSVATIARPGPFSAFDGVVRSFAVLDGAGVRLRFADRAIECTRPSGVVRFDGAAPPDCDLLDGPTQDLNLMVRAAAGRGAMTQAPVGRSTLTSHPWRAVYAAEAITLRCGGHDPQPLPAGTLAWSDDDRSTWSIDVPIAARAWCFVFDAAVAG